MNVPTSKVTSRRMVGVKSSTPSPAAEAKAPPKPKMVPTDEQNHAISLVTDTSSNICLNSGPGSAKTTTCKLMDHAGPEPILYIAFNKRIVEAAAEERTAAEEDDSIIAFSDTTELRTFNSIGHQALQGVTESKLVLNIKKNSDILRAVINDLPTRSQQQEAWDEYFEVTSAVALGKCMGYVPEGKFPRARRLCGYEELAARLDTQLSDFGAELLDEVFVRSIKAAEGGAIDYDDQIYMPALFGGTFPRFPFVVIDEAQDANACNHALCAKFRGARIAAVGDDGQSIYAFRGAVPGGMAKLSETFGMVQANLTVSFRCPENIAKAVQWHWPKIKWVKPGGIVVRLHDVTPQLFTPGCAIICRNNAPLFKLAFQLLANGRSVNVHGSDVGPKVIAIMRKLGNDNLSRTSVLKAIDQWESEKLARQSSTASDIADCMRVFARHGRTLYDAISWAENLFAQKGTVQLLTGHKSKGLEWDTVYFLDPGLIGQGEQEDNLRGVIMSRSKQELYLIESKEIRWPDVNPNE